MNSPFCRKVWLSVCAVCLALPATAAEFDQRLVNLSTRAQVGVGTNAPVVGFVIGDGPQKKVLIRAVGPTLGASPYNVPGVLANPRLELYAGNTKIAENDDWSTALAGNATTLASATTFTSVGAFGLNAGSRDAALVATLGPGNYSAQVTGVGTPNTGAVLLEVYDVTGSARLMNLSTRAFVSGAGSLISGLAIAPGGGVRKILVRAAGPTLGSIASLPGTLADPSIAVIDANGVTVASNDDWSTGNAAALSAAFANAGAFAFLAGSKDAALIVDLLPNNNYSIQVNGVGNSTGLAIVEVYDITANTAGPSVSVAATNASTDSKGGVPAVFTITRTGSTAAPLTVFYSLGGTAVVGVDYATLPGSLTIPAGASSATVQVAAQNGPAILTINKDVTLSLVSGPAYALDGARTAAVTIFYNPGSLYVTPLRPSAGAASTAFGISTIQLSDDNTFAIVNLSFSNLSSPETVAYLRYGNPGEVGIDLIRLPNGQVNGQVWSIQGSGALTAADIIQGIKSGRVFVSIESASYPAGELRGAFIQSSGSGTFVPPTPAPTLPDTGLAASDASRFLIQATFGPTKAEIDALAGKRLADLNNWISAQIATPPSLLLAATQADFMRYTATGENPQFDYRNR
ncbi:MAG: CHRD domain-containing protein, partial [Opitutaceae bacterium]